MTESPMEPDLPHARPYNPALDAVLGKSFPVLDHGFVRVIDYMGDEAAICQAARVSYGRGTKSVTEDIGLLRYLLRHRHTTPFEMCEIKLHVKLPIFVARQWIRHRTANVNEYSARYSILDREFYIPEGDQVQRQSIVNKQGRGGDEYGPGERETIRGLLRKSMDSAFDTYELLIDDEPTEFGLSRELARTNLPLSTYTQWYWKVDLHNLLHFLSLRADPHAQYEIRAYAEVMCDLVRQWVPNVWKAFEDYVRNAHTFSGPELELLRSLLRSHSVKSKFWAVSTMSDRELRAFYAALGLDREPT